MKTSPECFSIRNSSLAIQVNWRKSTDCNGGKHVGVEEDLSRIMSPIMHLLAWAWVHWHDTCRGQGCPVKGKNTNCTLLATETNKNKINLWLRKFQNEKGQICQPINMTFRSLESNILNYRQSYELGLELTPKSKILHLKPSKDYCPIIQKQ